MAVNLLDQGRKLKVYLASRFENQHEMRQWKVALEAIGIEVTSRWISGEHNNILPIVAATQDLRDLDDADFILFHNPKELHGHGRGGRHVEYGYALAKSKGIIIVGEHENVFNSIYSAIVPTFEDALAILKTLL